MRKNYVAMAAFSLLLLAGCSNEVKDSDVNFESDAGVKVTFSAVINEQTGVDLTRATETDWEVGDRVGITCGSQQNIQYEYVGREGNMFTVPGGYADEIWVMGTQTYDVTAYYPFSGTSGEEAETINVSTGNDYQATADARKEIDFLYATGTANAQQPNVQLAFNHVMSRIKLKFEAGDGVTLGDIRCFLIGLKTSGTFNPNTGEVAVSEDATAEDLEWNNIGQSDNYTVEAILLPQTVDDEVSVQAGMNGYLYELHFPNLTVLEPGVSYNYTIQANQYVDGNKYVLSITQDNTQINGWQDREENMESDASMPSTSVSTNTADWGTPQEEEITPTPAK